MRERLWKLWRLISSLISCIKHHKVMRLKRHFTIQHRKSCVILFPEKCAPLTIPFCFCKLEGEASATLTGFVWSLWHMRKQELSLILCNMTFPVAVLTETTTHIHKAFVLWEAWDKHLHHLTPSSPPPTEMPVIVFIFLWGNGGTRD